MFLKILRNHFFAGMPVRFIKVENFAPEEEMTTSGEGVEERGEGEGVITKQEDNDEVMIYETIQ